MAPMKMMVLLVGAVLAGACSKSSGDSSSSAPPSPSAATPTATATATITMTAYAASATHPGPTSGACSELAQKCKTCPPGAVQTACTIAMNAGRLDPIACTNALNDKDIKAQCH
jgi:hypothetical protein